MLDTLADTLVTVLAAAEGEEESSKTAFYVLGGVLAAWAVVLAAIGLSRPAFPGNAGGQRIVMLISVVLMGGAIAAAVLTG